MQGLAGPSLKGLGYEAMVQDQLAYHLRVFDVRLWCQDWLAHALRILDTRLWCKTSHLDHLPTCNRHLCLYQKF